MEKVFYILALITFIFAVYNDYFHGGHYAMLLIIVSLLFGVIHYVLTRFSEKKPATKKDFVETCVISTCMMLLILVFYFAGGRSAHGINAWSPVIWFIYLYALIESYWRYKKALREA